MKLLGQVRDFRPRFLLLFQHATPQVAKRHGTALDLLEKWLVRRAEDKSVQADIAAALDGMRAAVQTLREARGFQTTRSESVSSWTPSALGVGDCTGFG